MTETSWKRARSLMDFHDELPLSFWGRALVLWGLAPAPFFAAFDEANSMEERKDATSLGRGSSACSGRGRAVCRTRRP
jgi:hypothetical protein